MSADIPNSFTQAGAFQAAKNSAANKIVIRDMPMGPQEINNPAIPTDSLMILIFKCETMGYLTLQI